MEPFQQALAGLPPPGHVSTWIFAAVVTLLTSGITWLAVLYVKSRNHERQTQGDANKALADFSRELLNISVDLTKSNEEVAHQLRSVAERLDRLAAEVRRGHNHG